MPFKSKAQMRYLYAKDPEVAKEFSSKTKDIKKLPERIKKKRRLISKRRLKNGRNSNSRTRET